MSEDWNTKYGTRRVRRDPPTLEEAIFAAVGITDDQQQQAEIASALMGLPFEEVLAEVKKTGRAVGAISHPRHHGRARRAALGRGRAPRGPPLRQRQAYGHLRASRPRAIRAIRIRELPSSERFGQAVRPQPYIRNNMPQ